MTTSTPAPRRPRLRLAAGLIALLLTGCSGQDTSEATPAPDPATLRNPAAGPVLGFTTDTGAHAWLGVPYAAPPVGPRRWRAPAPASPWSQPHEALAFGPVCPQYGSPLGGTHPDTYGRLTGSEDCLYLNIWAPASIAADTGEAKALPVMLWIHGGGNVAGHGGFYDGANLAKTHDVIVLTFNYRLGPLGWFQHRKLHAGADPAEASGNFATLDIIAALQWIQRNIAAFGGDPERVTIFGESAGATNVATLLASPLASGLFHRAIMQSGGTHTATPAYAANYVDAADPGHPNSSAEVVARLLHQAGPAPSAAAARTLAEQMPTDQLAGFLRGVTTQALFAAYGDGDGLGVEQPTVIADGHVIPAEPLLDVLADPLRHDGVPVLLGTNRDEPKIFMAFDPEQVVRAFGLPLWARDAEAYQLEAEYGARAWKVRGTDAPAAALLRANTPAYAYRWDWDEEGNLLFVNVSRLVGAAHGLEIPFVFGHFDVGPQTNVIYHDDNAAGRQTLSAAMMSYWAEFAYSGAPGRGRDGQLPAWRAYDTAPSAERLMLLDSDADGGLRMTDLMTTRADILADLRSDPRIVDAEQRCALFDAAFRWSMDAELIEARRTLCPDD